MMMNTKVKLKSYYLLNLYRSFQTKTAIQELKSEREEEGHSQSDHSLLYSIIAITESSCGKRDGLNVKTFSSELKFNY